MIGRILQSAVLIVFVTVGSQAQDLDPAKLLKPPTDTWATYNGDYSGRRHSPLSQINQSTIHSLALKWMYRTNIANLRGQASIQIKSTPLEVNGILYFT